MKPLESFRLPSWVTPVGVAFLGSLLLTVIAHQGKAINLDGTLYMHAALEFLDGGYDAAKKVFSLPFLSILMALVGKLTGLGPEHAAYLMNALFQAGASALVVSCVGRTGPELAWPACLAVLAIPGINEYRHELVRECGGWFFVMLGIWLALRWDENPRWMTVLATQASLAIAVLFRVEAVTFFVALFLWQAWKAPRTERARRLLMVGGPPIIGGIVLLGLYFGGSIPRTNRVTEELLRFNFASFDAKTQALAGSLIDYAKANAGTILLAGSLAIVPLKIIGKLDLLLVPLAFAIFSGQFRSVLGRFALFGWGIAACLLALEVFAANLQFVSGRNTGLLLLCAVPFVSFGLWQMMQRYSRWRMLIVLLAVLTMIANLKAFGPNSRYYAEAGAWLSHNVKDTSRVYNDSGRMLHYAGWYKLVLNDKKNRNSIASDLAENKYDYFVLEVSPRDPPIQPWLEKSGLKVLQRFDQASGKGAVVVAVPARN